MTTREQYLKTLQENVNKMRSDTLPSMEALARHMKHGRFTIGPNGSLSLVQTWEDDDSTMIDEERVVIRLDWNRGFYLTLHEPQWRNIPFALPFYLPNVDDAKHHAILASYYIADLGVEEAVIKMIDIDRRRT